MLYEIRNGTLSAGGQEILSHIDFSIRGKEKVAVVGRNGAGKTTLLRLIAGELSLDRDDKRQFPGIHTDRQITTGFLAQTPAALMDTTVDQLIWSTCPVAEPYSREWFYYEMEYHRIFTGLGFELKDKTRPLSTFSGGQQTRIALIHLLLQKPDILLLDEPTNHLDIEAVEWLEDYMRHFDGAVIYVSHDRFFLDEVAEIVYELEDGRLRKYTGNYTAYRLEKCREIERQRKAYERQQEELERLNGLVEKFKHKPNKAAFARSRRTMMQRMEVIPKPREDDIHTFAAPLEPAVTGAKWVLEAEHLKIGYEKALLELSLRVRRGQKIGIIGENGTGKTTFLKTVYGQLPALEGSLTIGNQILMGYFDQQTGAMESEKQVIEVFHETFPAMPEKEARHTLSSYLFTGKDAGKKISELSGGEKSRLALCILLEQRPNLLLLDEPTNHMDVPARETLESAFRAYTGTMLFVSHDRYFLEQVADAILVLDGRQVMYYPFGYRHYLEHVRRKALGDSISARITAENQALIADLRAVPKGERHRLREIDTEEAYLEWRLKQFEEPMLQAEEAFRRAYGDWRLRTEEKYQEQYRQWFEQTDEGLLTPDGAAAPAPVDLESMWTDACLQWYDMYLDLE